MYAQMLSYVKPDGDTLKPSLSKRGTIQRMEMIFPNDELALVSSHLDGNNGHLTYTNARVYIHFL